MPIDLALLEKLDALRRDFAAGLAMRFDLMDAALAASHDDLSNTTALPALLTALHSLAGAAGTFGLGELGEAARSAEQRVAGWMAQGCTAADVEALQSWLRDWRAAHCAG